LGIISCTPPSALRSPSDENGIHRTRVTEGDFYLVPARDRRRRDAKDFRNDVGGEGGTIDDRWGEDAPRDDGADRYDFG